MGGPEDEVLAALFGPSAVVATATPELVDERLFPGERSLVAGASRKRRAHFGTVRVCARRALEALGSPPVALLPSAGGAPRWPRGVVGSMSHDDELCAVVVDRSPPTASLGLDVELVRALDPGTIDIVLTPRERRWLTALPVEQRAAALILAFSAKEAYYKCQYPLSLTFLDFLDVELEFADRLANSPCEMAWTVGRFEARTRRLELPDRVRCLEGRFALGRRRVMCGVALDA